MNETQLLIVLAAIFPGAIKDNADFTSQVIDISDADYAEFHVTIGANDIAPAIMKVMESDTIANATTLAGSPALVHDVVTKPAGSDENKVWVVGVNCRKARKKYIQLQLKAGNGSAGTYAAATCVLRKSGKRSELAADRGVQIAEYA